MDHLKNGQKLIVCSTRHMEPTWAVPSATSCRALGWFLMPARSLSAMWPDESKVGDWSIRRTRLQKLRYRWTQRQPLRTMILSQTLLVPRYCDRVVSYSAADSR